MQIIHTVKELCERHGMTDRVAFVPTMGSLHEEHLALVCEAKEHADNMVVSIFVNCLQLEQGEDSDKHPHTLEQDAAKLEREDMVIVFAPDGEELYPNVEQRYDIEPPNLQNELYSRLRSGHFCGAVTVATELFNIVLPNAVCFGKKDYQQFAIVRGFTENLDFNVEIVPVDAGHASDDPILPSRNQYPSEDEHAEALHLFHRLNKIAEALHGGNLARAELEQTTVRNLTATGWTVDCVRICRAESLAATRTGGKDLVVLVTTRLGGARLTDNVEASLC